MKAYGESSMRIQIIKFNPEFDEVTGVKRVQLEDGTPVEYEIILEVDMPDNDAAYDEWGDKK